MKKILLLFSGIIISSESDSQVFTDSNLPIVVITTYNQFIDTAYLAKTMKMGIIDNGPGLRNYLTDPFNDYYGEVKVKLRGTSSLGFPKKSFKVVTIDSLDQKINVSILGMPADNDWVLKGIYPDKTLMRDELSFWLYNQMGHYSSRTRFVELVVDSNYRGVYCLLEKVKRDKFRVDISALTQADSSGDNLTGGYIIKLDKYIPGETGWFSGFPSNVTHDTALFFLYEYPNPDSILPVQKSYIKNFFDTFENTLAAAWWNNPDSGYYKYINIPSFIDNFIINELSKNVDGYRSSTFFYKDKDTKGDGKLHSGPIWDFDIAWNNCYYNGGNNPANWQYRHFPYDYFVPFWWWQIMSDTVFINQLNCRYRELRETVLSDSNVLGHIDSIAAYLEESQTRNFIKWPILGVYVEPNPSPIPATYSEEITNMKSFITQRFAWMDANIPGKCETGTGLELTLNDNSFKIYPNPFAENMSISYKVNRESTVKLAIINLLGEQIFASEKRINAGMHYEELNLSDLSAGSYVIRLDFGGNRAYSKILKMN